MVFNQLDQIEGHFQITKGIAREDIRGIAFNEKATSVQFCEPLADEDYDHLEEFLFSVRTDVELRAYEHQAEPCDLSFIKRIPSVKKISIDNIEEAIGFEHLSLLKSVESLSIGINNLDNLDFLYDFEDNLTELSIAGVKLKKTKLDFLPKFKNLETLCIEGQYENLHQISHLTELRRLYLRSVRTENLEFLLGLKKLWLLDVKLGRMTDMSALTQVPGIKQLTLCQLRGLEDLSFISQMTNLQYLSLISIKNLEKLPSFEYLKKLRRVFLENLRDLRDFKSLESAPGLHEFIYHDVNLHISDNIDAVLKNPVLKEIRVKFSEDNKNAEFMKRVREHKKGIFKLRDFVFEA